MLKYLKKCNTCDGTGNIKGLGGITQACPDCSFNRKLVSAFNKIKIWFSNPFKSTPVAIPIVLFIFMAVGVCWRYYYISTLSDQLIIGLMTGCLTTFGLIFTGVKYKLDQASYNKSLFEKRYAIFLKVDEILSLIEKDRENMDWRHFSKELDSIYRKSFFLFSSETYKFIIEFKKVIIELSYFLTLNLENEEARNKIYNARLFLAKLRDGQNLSNKFPELKIDFY